MVGVGMVVGDGVVATAGVSVAVGEATVAGNASARGEAGGLAEQAEQRSNTIHQMECRTALLVNIVIKTVFRQEHSLRKN